MLIQPCPAASLQERRRKGHPGVSQHNVRHGFASRIAETTGNLRIVQQVLGHVRLSSTETYVHPSRAELERAVAAIEGRVAL